MSDAAIAKGSEGSTPALGMMPSMSAACTPLKHRYDGCFNRWFEDYLGLSPVAGGASSAAGSTSSADSSGGGSSRTSSSSSRSAFWSSSSGSTGGAGAASTLDGAQRSTSDRKALRERLEGECGAMWREYQSCVLRAVKENELDGLITEARVHNPFPFPKDIPSGKPNNEPFPFPAAERAER